MASMGQAGRALEVLPSCTPGALPHAAAQQQAMQAPPRWPPQQYAGSCLLSASPSLLSAQSEQQRAGSLSCTGLGQSPASSPVPVPLPALPALAAPAREQVQAGALAEQAGPLNTAAFIGVVGTVLGVLDVLQVGGTVVTQSCWWGDSCTPTH